MPLRMTDEQLISKVRELRKLMTSYDPEVRRGAEMAILHLYVPEMMMRISVDADS